MWLFFEFVFFFFVVFGSLIVISSSSWFMLWVGLELNMISFISLIGSSSSVRSEVLLKYFFVQGIGSLIFLIMSMFGFVFFGYGGFFYDYYYFMIFLVMIMMLKLGAGPFYFWFPLVIDGLDWMMCLMLMTWQKIAPLWVINLLFVDDFFLLSMGLFSVFIGGVGGMNSMVFRKIFAYSSIGHMGWLCILVCYSENVGFIYFFSYVILSFSVIFPLLKSSYSHLFHYYFSFVWSKMMLFCFFLSLFSISGLPPLFGFFPKWLGLVMLIEFGYSFFGYLILLFGLMSMYFYMRVGYVFLMNWCGVSDWLKFSYSLNYFSFFYMLFSLSMFFFFIIFV